MTFIYTRDASFSTINNTLIKDTNIFIMVNMIMC